MKTYISLFSSAGIGCYGFQMEDFECIATNELVERRLSIQKANKKCKYDSGYICGDITLPETKEALYSEIEKWKKNEHVKQVDVVIATPPCQGMSVANHKKTNNEIVRNSLVIESIKIIMTIRPKFFVFENVPSFMKTVCTDIDGHDKPIGEAISDNLGNDYSYASRIINFKNYGACSSRSRTVVIGVSNTFADEVSPFELFPSIKPEKTLREVIGDFIPLKEFGEIDPNDIFHSFRTYPKYMRTWISELKEGESAFDNEDILKKPHRVIDGNLVINQKKNADKYRRQYWDKVGPCVHTRNDQLASQNTIHPADDRVFSIRELMRMMTVPDSFRWCEEDPRVLNSLPLAEKKAFLKREEIKIRQSLGEAVPTIIFKEVAHNISAVLMHRQLNSVGINRIVANNDFDDAAQLLSFVENNPLNLSLSALCRIAELSNTRRTDDAAFYTNKALITEMVKNLPDFEEDEISILEPSVGVGSFIPLLLKKYEGKHLKIDLVDIDEHSTRLASVLLNKYGVPDTCEINYIVDDFLLHKFDKTYDLVIGNPPFYKMKGNDKALKEYRKSAINKDTTNICSFFLDKAIRLGRYIALVFPKFILNTPEFTASRSYLSRKAVECIIDFGEKGFPGVLIETLALFVNNQNKPKQTKVISITHNLHLMQEQKYIFDPALPYWLIYRNELFDSVCRKLDFNIFTVFRDRQITCSSVTKKGDIRVLKSRNISDDGKDIIDLDGYDSYICNDDARKLSVYEYLERDDVYLTPNMTYKPRVIRKPKGVLVNGSVAILVPTTQIVLSERQCLYFSSNEYRQFYQIARNYQTRSLNVDACSVFFYGVLRDTLKDVANEEKGHMPSACYNGRIMNAD